jgi:hypothetical protein
MQIHATRFKAAQPPTNQDEQGKKTASQSKLQYATQAETDFPTDKGPSKQP